MLAIGSPRQAFLHRNGPELVAAGLLVAFLVAVLTVVSTRIGADALLIAPLLLVCLFLIFNPCVELSLALLALYLGLMDGYLKLSAGSAIGTVGRDLLLYSIVVGALLRLAISGERLRLPKYTAHIALFVAVVCVQALNPATPGIKAAVGGLRQHLEFVPLFFFGYLYMRNAKRLQVFLVLLLVVVAINAVVAAIQFGMTPQELAGWGPGYRERILGTGAFEGGARIFADSSGTARVRPFGLGSDLGAAGVLGWSAIGAALALIAIPHAPRMRLTGIVGLIFCVIAILTSQSRLAVVAAVFVPLAFLALSVTSKNATRGLVTLIVGGLVVYVAATTFVASSDTNVVSRLDTLASDRIESTIAQDRGTSLELVPGYALSYPLGVGLGRAGPAAGFGGSASVINAENEPNFLIGELGTVGFVILAALWLRVLVGGVQAVRRTRDTRIRICLAALVASMLGAVLAWFAALPTTNTPTSPLFWFGAGVVAWAISQEPGGSDAASATPTQRLSSM